MTGVKLFLRGYAVRIVLKIFVRSDQIITTIPIIKQNVVRPACPMESRSFFFDYGLWTTDCRLCRHLLLFCHCTVYPGNPVVLFF